MRKDKADLKQEKVTFFRIKFHRVMPDCSGWECVAGCFAPEQNESALDLCEKGNRGGERFFFRAKGAFCIAGVKCIGSR